MGASLFIITSPLQYLNALEARFHFKLRPEDCVLLVIPSRDHERSRKQIAKLLETDQWSRVETVLGMPPERLVLRPRAKREYQFFAGARQFRRQAVGILRALGPVDSIFLGDWRARSFRFFAFQNPEAKVYLLDDGSITSQALRFRNDPRDPLIEKRAFPESNSLKLRAAGVPFYDPERITFFTSYALPMPRRDELVRHEFPLLSQNSGEWECLDEVWFIGSNHPENNITTSDRYLGLMGEIARFFEGERVRYFAHRAEDKSKLRSLEKLGFLVTHSELPLEMVIKEQKRYPKFAAAIASSVIDNLSAMLGARIGLLLFLAPRGYYRSRVKHLAEIVRYHREVVGGNLFVVPPSQSVDDPDIFQGPVRQSNFAAYKVLFERFVSLTAYGLQASDPSGVSMFLEMSGSTAVPSKLNNCGFRTLQSTIGLKQEVAANELQRGIQTEPELKSVGSPTPHGRRFWAEFEGGSNNLFVGDARQYLSSGCRLDSLPSAHSVLSPRGRRDALHLVESGEMGEHFLEFEDFAFEEGREYWISLHLKRAGRERVLLTLDENSIRHEAVFDLASGSLVGDGLSGRIFALPEQWFRVALRFKPTKNGSAKLRLFLLERSGGPSRTRYLGDGLSGVYCFGFQLSRGSSCPAFLASRLGEASVRRGDSVRLRFEPGVAPEPGLCVMQVHHGSDGDELSPLLACGMGDVVALVLQANPLVLRLSSPLVPDWGLELVLSRRRTQRLVISLCRDTGELHIAVNGIVETVRLTDELLACRLTEWRVGESTERYFRFAVEEMRLAPCSTSVDEVQVLSRRPPL